MAVTAVSMLPWPEMMTTGRSGWAFLMMLSTSRPSSRLPCSQMSRMTSCGRRSSIGLEGLVAVARQTRAVTVVLQDAGDHLADVGLVVDDQDVRCHLSLLQLVGDHAPPSAAAGLGLALAMTRPAAAVLSRQRDADQRAVRAPGRRRRVLERQRAAVLLDALLHDGKAEAGALVALGGDVGLEQARAVLLGQARAVVDHLDVDAVAVAAHDRLDARRASPVPCPALSRSACDRLLGVLDEIV